MSTSCLKRPTRPPPMPPTIDLDHDSNNGKQHHNGHQQAHFDTPPPHNHQNTSRYNFQHNTLHNHRHQHHQYNLNDRHHQTMVTILPSQHGYDRSTTSSSQTSDPHHLGHQHSHSFSHTNSFTLGKHHHHQHPSSRFHEKNDFYLQHKHQQLHNFSTSTSRRSHHSQYNSKSRINDYIKISDCQSKAPQSSNYLEASYMLPSPLSNHNVSHSNDRLQSRSTEYKQVDFIKTDALQDLKVEKADRERGKST